MAFASFSTPSLLLEEGGVVTISLENREKEKIPCNKRTTKYTTNLFWDGSQQSQSGCEVTSCKSVWLIANFELWIKIGRISMWLLIWLFWKIYIQLLSSNQRVQFLDHVKFGPRKISIVLFILFLQSPYSRVSY